MLFGSHQCFIYGQLDLGGSDVYARGVAARRETRVGAMMRGIRHAQQTNDYQACDVGAIINGDEEQPLDALVGTPGCDYTPQLPIGQTA